MTHRTNQCIITFDQEIREDDFVEMAKTFMSIKGVRSVDQIDPDEERAKQFAKIDAKSEIREQFEKFYNESLVPRWWAK